MCISVLAYFLSDVWPILSILFCNREVHSWNILLCLNCKSLAGTQHRALVIWHTAVTLSIVIKCAHAPYSSTCNAITAEVKKRNFPLTDEHLLLGKHPWHYPPIRFLIILLYHYYFSLMPRHGGSSLAGCCRPHQQHSSPETYSGVFALCF